MAVAFKYNRMFMFSVLCVLSIRTACLSKEPDKPYNFHNAANACWLTSYLQCLYRLEPLQDLLKKLPAKEQSDSPALKFAHLIKKTFGTMTTKSWVKIPVFKESGNLLEIDNLPHYDPYDPLIEGFPKKLYDAIYLKAADVFRHHLGKVPFENRITSNYQEFSTDFCEAIERLKHTLPQERIHKLGVYLEILQYYNPSRKNGMSDNFVIDHFFQYVIRKAFKIKRLILAHYFQITPQPLPLGNQYELVAQVVTIGSSHVAAVVRYENKWWIYDSLYGEVAEPREAHIVSSLDGETRFYSSLYDNKLNQLFFGNQEEAGKFKKEGFPVDFYFYQKSELSIKLFELNQKLSVLREKLFILKSKLELLKNNLVKRV